MVLRKIIKKHDIDIGIGVGDFPLAWAAIGTKCKSFIFTDSEHVKIDRFLTYPFSTHILTPSCFLKDIGPKQIRYNGYHELAYLHPNWFTPDPSVLDELKVSKDDKYVIIRFVSWAASHDAGQTGFTNEEKTRLIKEIEKYAIPMITSEGQLPEEFQKYQINIPPHRIHDAMYYANMYIGESGTMASEAAVMGTPSILVSPLAKECGIFKDQAENYHLMNYFDTGPEGHDATIMLLENRNSKRIWQERKKKLLNEKIDVTKYLIELCEHEYTGMGKTNE